MPSIVSSNSSLPHARPQPARARRAHLQRPLSHRPSWRWQDGSGNSKLTHTGNILLHYRDNDGNGSATGTGEFNDTRTYSDANELLTRDTDSSGGTADYTLVYDAVGNEIDDGIYKKTYDTRGRLTTVKNQSNALVASYTYNAYGYLTTRHYDINLANGVTSADPKICMLYDERWRIVGTFRYDPTIALNDGKNEPPAEMFLHHTAGLGGYGGSSYIDAVLMRAGHDPSNWGSEAEQVFGYFIYTMQNWRGDVVFVVKANGQVLEWVQYYAFGSSFLVRGFDGNSDGNVTIDDVYLFFDLWNEGEYDVRLDPDGSGEHDADDFALIQSGFWGHEVLSDVGTHLAILRRAPPHVLSCTAEKRIHSCNPGPTVRLRAAAGDGLRVPPRSALRSWCFRPPAPTPIATTRSPPPASPTPPCLRAFVPPLPPCLFRAQ